MRPNVGEAAGAAPGSGAGSGSGSAKEAQPPTPLGHDGTSGVPLYRALQRRLTHALAEGQWKPGEALPSESRLSMQYAVSIGTVRRAIDELVAGKILVRQQGRGTFVAAHTADRLLFHFFHVVARSRGSTRSTERPVTAPREMPSTSLRKFRRMPAPAGIAQDLGIARGAPVLHIENLLELGGRAVILDEISISARIFPDLDRHRFEQRSGTIYGLYQQAYGISVVRSNERLSAVACPASIAQPLGLAPGHPVLSIRRIAYTYADRPVESRVSWVDTREHEYLSDLWKNDPDHER
ncbi:MAG: GntR family transcriptional regulator [Proteobacteria bacterium]|nr:GntR family transcriptional regulator [Burkholderiales bacterium]